MHTLKIVYMGTPPFAVTPLKTLIDGGYNVVAVVTAPDRPAGRGREVKYTAVKQFALDNRLPVLQPEKLRDENFINELKSFDADLFVVVAFRMLPETVWSIPPRGTINLHASLLPAYRGAAPINHALMNGETETGVTTFFIDREIDTGRILLQSKVAIDDNETAGELHDKLMLTGAQLLLKTVGEIATGVATPVAQPLLTELKPAPKLSRTTCRIDWTQSPAQIRNFIRGLSPDPGAWGELSSGVNTLQFKILRAQAENCETGCDVGKIVSDGRKYLKIACNGGYVNVEEIQLQGKKTLPVKAFLAGFKCAGYKVLP
jgi:methionyl-tRNA formyltransferase